MAAVNEEPTPGPNMTKEDAQQLYTWAMRNARRALLEALALPEGSGGRGVEAQTAHSLILFAQELRAGYEMRFGITP